MSDFHYSSYLNVSFPTPSKSSYLIATKYESTIRQSHKKVKECHSLFSLVWLLGANPIK